MKKYLFLALLGLTFALYSCSDSDDDNGIDDNITTEVIKTDKEAISRGNAVYVPLQTLSSSFSFLIELATDNTISFEIGETKGGPTISRLEHAARTSDDTPHDYPNKVFSALYNTIGVSNDVIEKLDSSKVTPLLSQETKDLVKARVKFTRALSYLYLVQIYGEVPLKLKKADASVTSRTSIDEIYTQIVKDLTEAETYLPPFDSNKANPSKGAANAILARAYLAWGQNPLSQTEVNAIKDAKTDPAHSVDNAKLQKAVEYADKVINSKAYILLADYNRNFGVAGENGEEHIYTIDHLGDGVDAGQSNHQTHCTFTNRFTNLKQDIHIGPADETLLNRFDNADKRKLLSLSTRLFDSDNSNRLYNFAFPVTTPIYGKWVHRGGYATTGNIPTIERAAGSSVAQPNNINRIEIRYAEVLLIKAEALFFLNKASEGLPLINQLRERAFGDNTHNLTTLTKEALFKEWELELTFEQKRWTNLVRWKNLISTIQTVKDFEYFKEGYKDPESVIATSAARGFTNVADLNPAFYAKVYKHLHAKYNNVKGKHYRFPIPQLSGIDLGVTPQNPGY